MKVNQLLFVLIISLSVISQTKHYYKNNNNVGHIIKDREIRSKIEQYGEPIILDVPSVKDIKFSPNGKFIAVSSLNKVYLFDIYAERNKLRNKQIDKARQEETTEEVTP